MRAWLDNESTTPVHLEHYDTLADGAIEYRDRRGLDLSPRERERLDRALEATRRMADVLERARRGEIEIRDAVRDVLAAADPRLGEIVTKLDALRQAAATWPARWEALVAALKALATTEEARKIVDELARSSDDVAELAKIHESLRTLRDGWRTRTPAEVLAAAWKLYGDVTAFLARFKDGGFEASVRKHLDKLAELVGEAWAGSDARRLAEAFVDDARQAVDVLRAALSLLGVGALQPTDPLPPAETIDVPVEEARDTFLDLRRTPRIEGDVFTVKWELIEDGRVVDSSRASFEARRFGHHATLEPSVVLATPSRMAGGDSDDFHFAPALSWMHRYTPEPDDAGAVRAVLGGLDPAIGLHATFLNFDPDKEVEIGLGGTFSLWGDVVQVGAGYNLMAEASDEGGVYFFVGSSLIGLLQKLGLAGAPSGR